MPHLIDRIRTWLGRPKPYGRRHFRQREALRADYRLLARSLLRHLDFGAVLDVGCANAFLLEVFRDAGREVAGIEASPAIRSVLAPELCGVVRIGDFREALDLVRAGGPGAWDLVACVEVAEHIEPDRSEELVETLVSVAGRWIYFTAAPPGQTGHGHINCRPHGEWLAWFEARGWAPAPPETDAVRRDLSHLGRAVWLRGNSFVLQRG
ncbi:MAG: class I SAM-dependent methyltransferase [Thermoanaerobaculia bacterium]